LKAPVRFVYFDLDDTLLDHQKAQNGALEDLHTLMPAFRGSDLARVRTAYQRVNGRVWREYAAGTRDKEGTRTGRFQLLFEALAIAGDAQQAAELYLNAYATHWTIVDGAWSAYSKIAAHFPTGLLTNGFAETQRDKLRRFPRLAESLDALVISEEEGVLKPHVSLFRIATERAGVPAENIVYVGDSLRSDILGGIAADWQVVWYTQDDSQAPDGVPCFADWAQLPNLLGI
jgi:pyrimidine 5'-nucleotidase